MQRHIVVFDCNIYLDAALLVGPPFTWEKFDALVAKLTDKNIAKAAGHDSARAIAVCQSGRFAADEVLEVWTSAQIDKIVRGKARQSVTPDERTGYRGLGWTNENANKLVTDLIGSLTESSNGGSLGGNIPDGNPPLDHEDGMVYGACRELSSSDPLCLVYCVTRDKGFIKAYENGELGDHSRVLTPSKFVGLVRAARAHYAMPGPNRSAQS